MKITMLGTTGAGKTCYMLGMYSFMSVGLHGFTINAKEPDIDIDLNDKWETLVVEQGEERWPPATQPQSQEDPVYKYAFNFCYGFKPIMSFNWLDYRGGALRDKTKPSDTQQLFEYAKESDCLFLCVSGEYFKQAIVETDGKTNFGVRQKVATRLNLTMMNNLITELQQKRKPTNDNPFPVAIVITKYDLCMERGKEAIVQDIKQLFEPLFQPESGWLVMVCPVSLGKELATNKDSGEIEPINIDKPVAFAIYSKLQSRALETKNSKNNTQQSLEKDKERNFLIRWMYDDDIANNEARLRELEGKFQEIQANMALLAQELQKVPLFLGNKEVTPDVTI